MHESFKDDVKKSDQTPQGITEFMDNPSTAPISKITDVRDVEVDANKHAAAFALRNMNPSHGAESVPNAVADAAIDTAKGYAMDKAIDRARNPKTPAPQPNQTPKPSPAPKPNPEPKPKPDPGKTPPKPPVPQPPPCAYSKKGC